MHTGVPRYLFEKSSRPALAERRLHRSVVMLTLLAGALLLAGCEKNEEKPKPSPPEVGVVEPLQQNVPTYDEWVAQLNGPGERRNHAQGAGLFAAQDYQNGYFVKKGQLLFEMDPRQYQAALDQAKADVAEAEANLARTQADVARDTPLAAQNAIPQKQLDTDIAYEKRGKSRSRPRRRPWTTPS